MDSEHLNQRQIEGLLKTGEVVVPGDEDLPSFTECGFVDEVDRILEHMNQQDREDFKTLLTISAYLPTPLVAFLLKLSEYDEYMPYFLGTRLRMLNIGVKGITAGLYYSDLTDGNKIHDEIGWRTSIETRERELDDAQKRSKEAAENARKNLLEEAEALNSVSVAQVVKDDADTVEEKFREARSGQEELRNTSVKERCRYIHRLREVIVDEREWIVDELQASTGKSGLDALVSVLTVLDHLLYLEKNAVDVLSDDEADTPFTLFGKDSRIYYEPLGTVLVISPWNYPFYQAVVPITSAFVAGNTVVYKPSEHTPLEGVVEELFDRSGFEGEWVQVVYGDGETGRELIDQRPDKIFFTGSQETGRKVMEQASEHLVPVELELGGKDPMIVFDDVDIEDTATGALWGGLTNTGQSCTSVEKLYVHEDIYDEFKDELLQQVECLEQDDTRDPGCDIGRMTTEFQIETVREHVMEAREGGATVLTGGGWDGETELIPPILIEDVTDDMLVATEETFGPVIPLYRFSSEEEVIEHANDTRYGLSASVWSGDLERADRVARALEVGNVSINNVMITEGNPALPFGGTKTSGYGRYKGEYGLKGFCNVKSVMSEENGGVEPNWYPYEERKYELFDDLIVSRFRDGLLSFPRFAVSGLRLNRYSDEVEKERNRED